MHYRIFTTLLTHSFVVSIYFSCVVHGVHKTGESILFLICFYTYSCSVLMFFFHFEKSLPASFIWSLFVVVCKMQISQTLQVSIL